MSARARAERQAAALLVVLAPIVACGVLAWLVIVAAFLAPECRPDGGPAAVCYWVAQDALEVGGRVVWSWPGDASPWRWDAQQ